MQSLCATVLLAGLIPIEPPCATWALIYSNDPLVCGEIIDAVVVLEQRPAPMMMHAYQVCIPGVEECVEPIDSHDGVACTTWAELVYERGTNNEVCQDSITSVALMPSGYGVWLCNDLTGCVIE